MTEVKLYNCYHWLLACELFTEQELKLVTDMCGYNIETLDKAVYCRFGYRTVDDLIEEVGGSE